ncbi:HEPN domain protein [Thiorhodovibrio winogradskyi]|uniref:HEPN domain protein n=1 Tax=Thiorhodovibrio winogradskyi TaxID=77007 RepID=A0ABZ0S7P0_9GAMM|nr:HEPN domain-containing protein [Thiorhodovibrio winogradskyi]
MTPADYLSKARRALASACLLLADGDTEGACNRAYYAMFDAAHAALLHADPGLNPATTKTHRGLIAAFGEQLVMTGLIPADLGRSINQVERIRLF